MKNKLVFAGLLIAVLVIEIVTVGCATTPKEPPYPFDGTSWTKTEDYELRFANSRWEVWCGSVRLGSSSDMTSWKVDGNTLSFGNDEWGNFKGHGAGEWALKSGTPSASSLEGTIWTRTAVLELSFEDGKLFSKDGSHQTCYNPSTKQYGIPYKTTVKNITVRWASDNAPRGTYVVDGNTLTVIAGQGYQFDATRLDGTPWTKK